MSKIRKPVIDAVEEALTGAKVARTVAQDAKPLRGVLSPVTAKPSRIKGIRTVEQKGIKTLYRGLEQPYNPSYNLSRTDAPIGYSTWTDNPELARKYAGQNGYVYQINLPELELGNEMIDANGNRVLFINNQKGAGLDGIFGNEYLIYQDHELFTPDMIKQSRGNK